MSTLPTTSSLTSNATTQATQKTNFTNLRNVIAEIPGGTAAADVTISSGSVTVPTGQCQLNVDTESAASNNDLTTIDSTNCRTGQRVTLRMADSGHVVTVKDGTGADLIDTRQSGDIVMDETMMIEAEFDGTQWFVVGIFWGTNTAGLLSSLGLGTAATANTGTGSSDVPTITDADGRYGKKKNVMGGSAPTTQLTIASGIVTPTGSLHKIETEGAASSDDLAEMAQTNIDDGGIVVLRAYDTDHTVVVKHNAGSTTNPFLLASGLDYSLDNLYKVLIVQRVGSSWYEIARGGEIPITSTPLTAGAMKILYGNGSGYRELAAPGAGDYYLKSNSGNTDLEWAAASGASRFTSADQTPTAGTTKSVAHGLGSAPAHFWAYIRCTSADAGHSSGDRVFVGSSMPDSGAAYGVSIGVSSSNIWAKLAGTGLTVCDSGAGYAATAIDPAKWKLVLLAEL